jgi:hypothetical protein
VFLCGPCQGFIKWYRQKTGRRFSRFLLLLCFGGSLHCQRKRFSLRCLGIDVTPNAMHCIFSRIRCCGNVFQQFTVQQRCVPRYHGKVLSEAPPSTRADCSFQASCHSIMICMTTMRKLTLFINHFHSLFKFVLIRIYQKYLNLHFLYWTFHEDPMHLINLFEPPMIEFHNVHISAEYVRTTY